MPLARSQPWFGVVLDAPDASVLAHFYQRLLGWTLYKDSAEWATLAPDETSGYNLAFQREPNYVRPVWPSRPGEPLMMVHLDIQVDDLEEATAYAVSVGAEVARIQPQQEVRCCYDPAGHPFCLYVDSDGVDPSGDTSPA